MDTVAAALPQAIAAVAPQENKLEVFDVMDVAFLDIFVFSSAFRRFSSSPGVVSVVGVDPGRDVNFSNPSSNLNETNVGVSCSDLRKPQDFDVPS